MTTVGGPFEAIVLAAGAGVRFGGRKLTAPWGAGLLIDGALVAAFASPALRVTVVTGADAGVGPAARRFVKARGEGSRLRLVHAADHQAGMAASLRAGLSALSADTAAVFVFLGDMPAIPRDLPALLAAELLRTGAAACAPLHLGERGHPVLFAAELFDDLRRLEGDHGARAVLDALGERLALLPTDDGGTRYDIDAPATLQRLCPNPMPKL